MKTGFVRTRNPSARAPTAARTIVLTCEKTATLRSGTVPAESCYPTTPRAAPLQLPPTLSGRPARSGGLSREACTAT
ncbi:hypothetical protein GCM10009779_28980 [Polymorphospora rubra]|uniref:Uncharacterized protein n=1 Tax=Polymorphospora rubra TaxID=338584 RepID=A0A810N7N6_9ACTN|nr:hypothetical protein Prubr_44360 [Polymorphospora rubra]